MYYLGIGFNSAPAHSFIVISCSTGVAVVEEGGIALHEGDGELLEEVGDSDGLVFPSVSGKCAAQLLDFIDGRLVPPAKALHCKRVCFVFAFSAASSICIPIFCWVNLVFSKVDF